MENNYLKVVYDKKSHPKSEYPKQLIDYLCQRFNIKDDYYILDNGCGTGDFLNAFKEKGLKVFGTDLINYDNINIFKVDFEKDRLPFEDNTFNFIITKSVIEHIFNVDGYLKEMYRVLKSGGRILILTPDYDTCQYLFWDDHDHKHPYRVEALSNLMKIYDFKEVQTEKFYQLKIIWDYPILKIVCRFLQLFGAPKRMVKNKFLRWSRELILLSSGIK
jgi:SAM-dependent methyltransferase